MYLRDVMYLPLGRSAALLALCAGSLVTAQARPEAPPLPIPASPAAAQSLVAQGEFVFVLRGDVLFQFDAATLGLLNTFDFAEHERTRRRQARRPAAREPAKAQSLAKPELLRPEETKAAIDAALGWLGRHQDENGRWDADAFMKHDLAEPPSDGPGNPVHDVGATALAMLAMLADGSTLRHGPYREHLKRATSWLRDQQQENGLIGTNASHDFVYDHALGTWALCEAYGLSNYKLLQQSAQRALDYLESHRNPYAVWRYQPRDNDNDTSVTTFAAAALCSGRSFGLQVNPTALQLIGVWYDQVTDEQGRAGYTKLGERSSRQHGDHAKRFPADAGEALTAAALFGRSMLGQTAKEKPVMKLGAELLLALPPQWRKERIDAYYWFFGTAAMYQLGERFWAGWAPHLREIAAQQRKDGNFAGSWDPVGVWDEDGGRIYSTALYTLALQTLQRKARLVQPVDDGATIR